MDIWKKHDSSTIAKAGEHLLPSRNSKEAGETVAEEPGTWWMGMRSEGVGGWEKTWLCRTL